MGFINIFCRDKIIFNHDNLDDRSIKLILTQMTDWRTDKVIYRLYNDKWVHRIINKDQIVHIDYGFVNDPQHLTSWDEALDDLYRSYKKILRTEVAQAEDEDQKLHYDAVRNEVNRLFVSYLANTAPSGQDSSTVDDDGGSRSDDEPEEDPPD